MPEMLLTKEDLQTPIEPVTEAQPINLLAAQAQPQPGITPDRQGLLSKILTSAPVAMPAAAGQELAQQIANVTMLPINVVRGLMGKQPQAAPQLPRAPGQETLAGKIGTLAGGGLGYAGTAEAMAPLGLAERLAPLAGKIAPAAEQAAIGGVYGAGQAPTTPGRGALVGGVTGTVLHGVGRGLSKAAQKAMQRAEVVYPRSKAALDSMLDKLRGSSTKETSAQDIFDRASQHFEELEGKPEIETARWVQPEQSIHTAYETPTKMAQEQGLKINQQPYMDKMDKIKQKEMEEGGLFDGDEELDEDQIKTMNYLNKWLKLKTPTFDKVDLAKRRLNKDIGRFKYDDQRRHIAMEAKDALKDTLSDSLGEDPEIKNLWETADQRYKDELLPFKKVPGGTKNKSPFYNRYAKGKPISGMVEEYLRPSKQKDPVELLNNLKHMMPDEESKDLVAYHYLRNQEGDPAKILSQYNKLGENQKNALFNKDDKQLLDSYSKLHEKNPSLFKEPTKKAPVQRGFESARTVGGLAGILGGHPDIGTLLLAYPYLQRLGAGVGGKLAGVGAQAVTSPTLRSLLIRGYGQGGQS